MNHWLLFGDGAIEVELPDRARLLTIPQVTPAIEDVAGAVRGALASPVASPPLAELVGPGSKVTIAFDDPALPVPAMDRPDFRETAIGVVLEELAAAGVAEQDVKLICANALHRKWRREELATIIGEELASLPPERLYCHDAEDPDQLVMLGETPHGAIVEVNRAVVESDQLIYVNVTPTPMNGGWKSVAVGLSTFRSIRSHHDPTHLWTERSIMDPGRSGFHKVIREMGDVIQAKLAESGRHILSIESTLSGTLPYGTASVFCGRMPDVHEQTLAALREEQVLDLDSPFDVVVYGLPNMDPYSSLAKINPLLLTNLGLGYAFGSFQGEPIVREGGIVILANPFLDDWDDVAHPSYREFFERLLPLEDNAPEKLWAEHVDDFASRPEYVEAYLNEFGNHGSHPFYMWNSVAMPRRRLEGIFVAGGDPDVVGRLGFERFETVEDAVAEAERRLGSDCSIAVPVIPPVFIPNVPVASG